VTCGYSLLLRKFAHQAIEHGASVVFIHGPHKVKGIEIYKNSAIFYSLGNFVYETHCLSRFPAEAYEERGLFARCGC
jgi:poly-gamma-glutamate capsule biosynthesis protein CapA/YwtB (metallophosphatase superfamily)